MNKFWQTEYKADRRAHNHRCRLCSRIIQVGELTFMYRFEWPGRRTKVYALHATCANQAHPDAPGKTYRQVIEEAAQ